MKHTAFIFPGQGAQYTGMGKDFYDTFKESRAIYDLACDVTGLDIGGLCFEKNEDLNITEYTQIALLTTELAMLAAVKSLGAASHGECRVKSWGICSFGSFRKNIPP